MTKIKLCGLSRREDIEAANRLRPDYIGFVFAGKSRRFVAKEQARMLKEMLAPDIAAVGVFVDEKPEIIAEYLSEGIIDLAQLHGAEKNDAAVWLTNRTGKPVIKAFCLRSREDLREAEGSAADYILLDAGAGDGKAFDWNWLEGMKRPFFLAGGLEASNVAAAIRTVRPFGVDVSSGIETNGRKDPGKMEEFVNAVRSAEEHE